MHILRFIGLIALGLAVAPSFGQQSPGGRGGLAPDQSPASRRPPPTTTPQSYGTEEIQTGQSRFATKCGFCHGRDAQGSESGPDLTRSELVAEDDRGDKIEPVIRTGRPEKGMPAFTLASTDITAIVAFIHDAKSKVESAAGGRRSIVAADLQTGNVEAGKRYFTAAGGCIKCHSLSGSFATIGSRLQGLALLERMLYPRGGGRSGAAYLPNVTITTSTGERVSGKLVYRDEFTISLIDFEGWNRSWPAAAVNVVGDDPLRDHAEQLGKYTDKEIHDVLAFLQTLR